MASALRRNPRSLLRRSPFASLSTAAAPDTEIPPPPPTCGAAAAADTETPPAIPATVSAKKALTLLKCALRSEKDPDRLVALFQSAAQHKHFHTDPLHVTLTVQKLARARRRDLIERLLDQSASDPAAPKSDGFLARIINLYSTAGMLNHAVRTLDAALASGRPVGERSLCAILNSFLKDGQFVRAVEAFTTLPKQLNITPGVIPHNILLQVLCRKGDLAAARQLLDEMSGRDSAKPNIISYTTVLHGYLSKGDEAGFEEILKLIKATGLALNVATFNCIITALCQKKEMAKAEDLLGVMAAKYAPPNRATFKSIIEAYYKVDDMESALRVYKRMKLTKWKDNRKDLASDADTFNMLLQGLIKKGEFASALPICREYLARKLVPGFGIVKRLVEGLKETGMVAEAEDLVKRMRATVKDGAVDGWKKVESEMSSTGVVNGWKVESEMSSTDAMVKDGAVDGWKDETEMSSTDAMVKDGAVDGWKDETEMSSTDAMVKDGAVDGWKDETEMSSTAAEIPQEI